MASFRSWLGAILCFFLLFVARRYTTGWAAPSFVALMLACVYIWKFVLRMPKLFKEFDLDAPDASQTELKSAAEKQQSASQEPAACQQQASASSSSSSSQADARPGEEASNEKTAPSSSAASSQLAGSQKQAPRQAASSHPAAISKCAPEDGKATPSVSSRSAPLDAKATDLSAENKEIRPKASDAVEHPAVGSTEKPWEDAAANVEVPTQAASPSRQVAEGEDPASATGGEAAEEQMAAAESASEEEQEEEESEAEEEKNSLADPERAQELRLEGNEHFKAGRLHDAREAYSEALHLSPPAGAAGSSASKDRAVLHCNRAACLSKLGRWADVVTDCGQAIELDPEYVKAYSRRSVAFEEQSKWSDAVEDLKKAIELDPELRAKECRRQAVLEKRAAEQFEKDKDEMMGKLKELGNSFLGKFGMSTDSFKMEQDPDTGSYSMKFQS